MKAQEVQSLLLRVPDGPAVAHLIVRVPEGSGRAAVCLLKQLSASFGPQPPEQPCFSIGFSFAGLEALGLPDAYLRLFRSLAPAFSEGAVRRSVHLGDSGLSAAQHWRPAFRQDRAHVLLSWHGAPATVRGQANDFAELWKKTFDTWPADPLEGLRLGAPGQHVGQWVHFGYRDGISEVCIDDELPRPTAPDCRRHAPGALLLGEVNDAGANPFVLSRSPDKVRAFFKDSSFGILRPMAQDLAAFEAQVDRGLAIATLVGAPERRDFVKAKMNGRWPNGALPRPGDLSATGPLTLDLARDDAGEGCPFGSHVRRMRAAPDAQGHRFERPLQRRSIPFGPAAWSGRPTDGVQRGLLGHFFCASIEDQFEHLLDQWAARAPLGFDPQDSALDPLIGPHDDANAALAVPLKGRPTQWLKGFGAWTTTLGTLYAWHPGRVGLQALIDDDFVAAEDEAPWL